jgi:hypothetical protein
LEILQAGYPFKSTDWIKREIEMVSAAGAKHTSPSWYAMRLQRITFQLVYLTRIIHEFS